MEVIHMKNRNTVLAACCFINLCLGSIYAWSVFAQAMTAYLNETVGMSLGAGELAIVYTVANCIGPVTMITGGKINDAFGPKSVILAGGILFGGGMFLSGFARSVGFLIFSFGILGGLGLGMAYGSAISTAVKFFPDKRGFAGGITTAAYGLSSVILPPIVSVIVKKTSAPTAFKLIGAIFMVIIALSTLFVEKYSDSASDTKMMSDGGDDKDWKQMIRMPLFYVMLVLLICGAFSGMMIISQASQIAVNMMGMSVESAAVMVSILALFNMTGRFVAGFLSDRIGRIGTLAFSCGLSAVAEICLMRSGAGSTALFYIGLAIVGICFGGFMGVYPGFTADCFGPRHNSVNYGIMCIGFALAGFLGPQFMKNIYNSTGAYTNAFLIACIFALAGLGLILPIRLMSDSQKEKTI